MGKPSARTDAGSKAERKFEKKLQFYANVRETVTSLNAQKNTNKRKKLRSRQRKLKAYDLSSLSESLPELKASKEPRPPSLKINSKTWQNLVLKEANKLKVVINHPAFQYDPFAAIYQHLQYSKPAADEDKPKKRGTKNGWKKVKREQLRSSSGPQPMET